MIERWDGKTTGFFAFELTDEDMKGTWREAPDSKAQPFTFTRLHFPSQSVADGASKLSGFYARTFESWIYVDGATPDAPPKEHKFTAWDWLRIRYVDGNVFAFYFRVQGGNGHLGAIQGLAQIQSEGRAEFTAPRSILPDRPPAKLGFEFEGDAVTVTERQDCGDYRGERAYFGDTLKRTDEHAVQHP